MIENSLKNLRIDRDRWRRVRLTTGSGDPCVWCSADTLYSDVHEEDDMFHNDYTQSSLHNPSQQIKSNKNKKTVFITTLYILNLPKQKFRFTEHRKTPPRTTHTAILIINVGHSIMYKIYFIIKSWIDIFSWNFFHGHVSPFSIWLIVSYITHIHLPALIQLAHVYTCKASTSIISSLLSKFSPLLIKAIARHHMNH